MVFWLFIWVSPNHFLGTSNFYFIPKNFHWKTISGSHKHLTNFHLWVNVMVWPCTRAIYTIWILILATMNLHPQIFRIITNRDIQIRDGYGKLVTKACVTMYLYIYSLVFVYTISENGPMPSLLAEATLTLYSVRGSSLVMTVPLSSLEKFIFVFSNLLLYSKTYPVISPFLLAQGTPDQLTVMEEDLICETLTDRGGPPGTVWEIEKNKSQIYCVITNFSSTRTYKREVELLIIYFFCECVNIIWYSSWANCYNTIKVTIKLKQLPNFLGLRTVLVSIL